MFRGSVRVDHCAIVTGRTIYMSVFRQFMVEFCFIKVPKDNEQSLCVPVLDALSVQPDIVQPRSGWPGVRCKHQRR